MNANLKIVVGALIGAGVGYLFADWYIDNYIPVDCSDEADGGGDFPFSEDPRPPLDEIQSNIEKFEEKLEMSKKKSAVVRNYTQFFDPKEKIRLEDLAEIYNKEGIATTNPEDEAQQIESMDAEDQELVDEFVDDDTPPDSNEPHVISVNDYADGEGYTKTSLTYYQDEDVILDNRGNPIRNPEKFLGEDALVSFGVGSDDEDIVYVRNPEKRADYEIVRSEKPYPGVKLSQPRRRPLSQPKEEGDAEGND